MLRNHMERTDNAINLWLCDAERFPVVLLAEDHFDADLLRIKGNDNSVRSGLRIALLESPAILGLNSEDSRICCRRKDHGLDD